MPIILHSMSKMFKKFMIIFGIKKSWEISNLNVECSGLNPVEKISRRDQMFFGQCPKMPKKQKVFKNNNICQNVTMDT